MQQNIRSPIAIAEPEPYSIENKRKKLIWRSLLRSTGSLGQRWVRRKPRQDWVRNPMAPGVDLITYWLDEQIGGGGTGPCMAVFCHGFEVLRFDCFGGTRGHFHITPFVPWTIFKSKYERRLQFREQTPKEQIEHALFEITENLDFYLQLNPRRSVRKVRVDLEVRRHVCAAAREQLHAHLANVPQLKALGEAERARLA